MKKYIILISAIFFMYGCEKEYNSITEPADYDYQVISVSSFEEFRYFPNDSTRAIRITFNTINKIQRVTYNLITPVGNNLYTSPKQMILSGGNSFVAELAMSKDYLNGSYTVKYYVTDLSGVTREAALHKFRYSNGFDNQAPVIANPLVTPDTIVVTQETILTVTVEVSDPDGLNDIELVYFISYRPDGTTSGVQTILSDNGIGTDVWDEVAGDGIFSQRIRVVESVTKGTWRFEFRARDRGKLYSNTLSYNVVIL
jgi:hypothetical protein